jgi:purine-nucleoside phosphorylase
MTFDLAHYLKQIDEAAAFIRKSLKEAPRAGIICGTGMGALADKVEDKAVLPYDTIPHFPVSTVESHKGNLMLGRLAGKPVVVMQGRFHYYEGYTMKQVVFPVRVMRALGCDTLVVMNAVGSMNPLIPRGSIVLVDDMINFMGDNPLLGPNDEKLGPRFPDMSQPFDKGLRRILREVAIDEKIRLEEGVLIAVAGPNLETRA